MMYPRLTLLRKFLREDGAIFVSIDDTEVGHCRLLMDEVFLPRNFVANLVWHKRVSPANDAKLFSTDHDHILVYARSLSHWHPNRLAHNEEQLKYYGNPDNDPRGPWNSAAYTCAKTADERPNLFYAITNPNNGKEIWPSRKRVWGYNQAAHAQNVADNLVWWGKDGLASKPRIKSFLQGARPVVPRSIWTHKEAGHNQEAKLEILELLSDQVHFVTPKPLRLLKRVIEIGADRDSIILDSFAGSGTTGHAVLAQNKADGGNRQFICIEMDEGICRDVTAQRIGKAIAGYGDKPGLGGGFRFCKLGAALFDESGSIGGEVRFPDLAAHVFFTETGSPLPARASGRTPLLGVYQGRAVYLLFNGVLGDRRPAGGNVLTHGVAQDLPAHPDGHGPRVVYGEACRLSAKSLEHYGITFRQIPFELKVD